MDKKIIGPDETINETVNIDTGNSPQEEENNMAIGLDNKKTKIQEMLDRISAKADKLTGKDKMIELDPNNPLHNEWFEEDIYKGK